MIITSQASADFEIAVYHVHQNNVTNGNCSSAGGHLDPYGNGGATCNSDDQASCEVGDLSGKHGTVPGTTFSAKYVLPINVRDIDTL